MAYIPSMDLVAGVLAGDTRAVARLLSRAESGVAEGRAALAEIFRRAGRAHIVGITGVPGSGKSTLVARLAAAIRVTGRKVAIIAIDPSSPFSGGAILGDRIRMGELAGDHGVYVRSMATRGSLGGLARGTLEAVDIVDAAGYDMVLIETVGVGQDEVDVVRASHTTVVVSAPGLGDDIQAIKAGVLEIADIHVVSKCDKPEAERTIADLTNMLALDVTHAHAHSAAASQEAWRPPIVPTTSLRNEGIASLLEHIDAHRRMLQQTDAMRDRMMAIATRRLQKAGEAMLRDRLAHVQEGRLAGLVDALVARRMAPHDAARELLAEFSMEG